MLNPVATSSISLVGLVAADMGIGLVVKSLSCIARSDVRYVELGGEPPGLGFALCHRPDFSGELRVSFVRALGELDGDT